MNPHGFLEIFVVNSGPSLVQEINSIKELRVHIPCISSWNQVFNLVVRQISNKDFYGDFAKEFLNMIQKNCQNLDEKAIWKDNGHYRASKICRIFF